MEFSKEESEKISKLPPFLRYAVKVLTGATEDVIDGNCSESELIDTLSTVKNNSESRYGNQDLVTYDDAARMLGIQVTNRVKLKSLIDKYGIKQVMIHNQKVGFRRSEIKILAERMNERDSGKGKGT